MLDLMVCSKRARLEDEEADSPLSHELEMSDTDVDGTTSLLAKVQKDIRTLRFMAKQKEKEWNYILKLMKIKEELQAKLMRRREILKITTARRVSPLPPTTSAAFNSSLDMAGLHMMHQQPPAPVYPHNFAGHQRSAGGSSSVGRETGVSSSSTSNLQSLMSQSLNSIMAQPNTSTGSKVNTTVSSRGAASPGAGHLAANVPFKGQHQHRQRPILPKPMQLSPEVQVWNTSTTSQPHLAHAQVPGGLVFLSFFFFVRLPQRPPNAGM